MRLIPITLALTLLPVAAFAHPALGPHAHGLVEGVSHPFTGLDHLLAMISVGVWASQKGGRAFWLWPASFVLAMIVGGVLGMTGFALPLVEPAIAASLLVLGLMIAGAINLPQGLGAALIALFGLFHGNAHGLEAGGAAAAYAIGFTLATVTLHALGLALGLSVHRAQARPALRLAAGLIAVTGAALFFL